MSTPDKSIDSRLLDVAKTEFLQNGFVNASIRKICADAGVTTGAFYKRYKTKEELFDALVSPALDELKTILSHISSEETESIKATETIDFIWANPNDGIMSFMQFMYNHYDAFRLVLCAAEGTSYSNFIHDMTELSCKGTMEVMGLAFEKGLIRYMPENDELHMLMTAYYSACTEPVRHGFSRKKALQYCESLNRLFDWKGFFGC